MQYIVDTVAKELMVDELLTDWFGGNIYGNRFQLAWSEQSDLKEVADLILVLQSLKFFNDFQIHYGHSNSQSLSPYAANGG